MSAGPLLQGPALRKRDLRRVIARIGPRNGMDSRHQRQSLGITCEINQSEEDRREGIDEQNDYKAERHRRFDTCDIWWAHRLFVGYSEQLETIIVN